MPEHLDRTEREALADEVGEGEVFLDIGANAGLYSLWMASLKEKNIQVEAFEPNRELCDRLRGNLERNRLSCVTLHECALGESNGEAILAREEGNLGQGRLQQEGGGERVVVRTLDTVLRERGIDAVAAIKIDVEGHECGVLKSWLKSLTHEQRTRIIVTEWIPGQAEPEIITVLLETGYQRVRRGRMNGIFKLAPQ